MFCQQGFTGASLRKVFLVAALLFTICYVIYDEEFVETIQSHKLYRRIFNWENITNDNDFMIVEKPKSKNSYALDTPGCQIPDIEILYAGYKRKPNRGPDCSKAGKVAILDVDTGMLNLQGEFRGGNCTVTEIMRSEKNDNAFVFADPEVIADTVNVSNKELFVTRCGNYYNLDANFPITPAIQEKIDYWQEQEDKPISVLFFGFDTCSRGHFLRSMPKAMKMAKEMGFVEFKGYHSVAPYTLENFLGFLVGMETPVLRAKCAPSWKSTFDKCPLAWNFYNENNFVTMYAEDGSQTFNWGGQGGFRSRPTDYYTHAMFKARVKLRKEFPLAKVDEACVNYLNAQTFLLKYIERFYRKHHDNPFFGFVWNNDATHDSLNKLAGMDEDMESLLKSLQEFPEALERTLVVFLGDHGARYGDVTNIDRPGAFLERSLPGFFIRVPKLLVDKFPDLDLNNVMKSNAASLTTGFDLYHTFKHLLILNGLSFTDNVTVNNVTSVQNITSENFEPELPDRTSLLLPVRGNRSCLTSNIRMGNCVCNTTSEVPAWENPIIRHKLIQFAFKDLNGLVQASKYKEMCKKWSPPMMTFVSARSTKSSETETDGVMRFIANPGSTIFEVQLKVVHENSTFDRVERLSNFVSISVYGEKSWCVGFETDEDKMLKEICTCKSKKDIAKLKKT